jgi:D-psicose/D-tagatose/L-ribulose 3-epimerase
MTDGATTRFGVHSLVFTDRWNEANARVTIDVAARLGFDLIEVLVTDFTSADAAVTRRLANDAGIGVATGIVLPPEADLSSPNRDIAARGEAIISRALEAASEIGSSAVSGLVYAGLDRYRAPPTTAQREQVVAALRRVDGKADSLGLRIGLEPINRYETYMINTIDEAAAMIAAIGSSNMFIHLDTFHMNIEEENSATAIEQHGRLIGYVHVADNSRGMPGSGAFDFEGLFRALARVNYSGDITLESFSPAVVGPEVVAATASWRAIWTDPVESARQGLDFLRREIASARGAIEHIQPA